jgi:VIT1/CCC1 family predicted Fe2+/Mn2+ transporter
MTGGTVHGACNESVLHSPVLDPIDRLQEVLFGLIMALTFTGTISVAESAHGEIKRVLIAAVGCNAAWGIVDSAMYLMAAFAERARRRMDMRRSLNAAPAEPLFELTDVTAAVGVFLLVFLSTFPLVIPFLLMRQVVPAVRLSHGIAIAMLFAIGWLFGEKVARSPLRTGLVMAAVGVVLAAITIALGG